MLKLMMADNFAVMIGNETVFAEALPAEARGTILAVGYVPLEIGDEIFKSVKPRSSNVRKACAKA